MRDGIVEKPCPECQGTGRHGACRDVRTDADFGGCYECRWLGICPECAGEGVIYVFQGGGFD